MSNSWIFTFGCGQKNAGKYVQIDGTYDEARSEMIERFGHSWAFQYSLEEWKEMENDPNRYWPLERPLT